MKRQIGGLINMAISSVKKECVFCKIISGKIHGHKIYEDKHTLAVLDLYPAANGHTLVIPKDHHTDIFDTPPKTLAAIMSTVKKISVHLKEKLGCHGVNIIANSGKEAGQIIFHIHFHIIPRFDGDGINFKVSRLKGINAPLDQMQEKLQIK